MLYEEDISSKIVEYSVEMKEEQASSTVVQEKLEFSQMKANESVDSLQWLAGLKDAEFL